MELGSGLPRSTASSRATMASSRSRAKLARAAPPKGASNWRRVAPWPLRGSQPCTRAEGAEPWRACSHCRRTGLCLS